MPFLILPQSSIFSFISISSCLYTQLNYPRVLEFASSSCYTAIAMDASALKPFLYTQFPYFITSLLSIHALSLNASFPGISSASFVLPSLLVIHRSYLAEILDAHVCFLK